MIRRSRRGGKIVCEGKGWYCCENEEDGVGSASGIVIVPDAVIPKPYLSFPVKLLKRLEYAQDGEGSTAIEMVSKGACHAPYKRLGQAAGC